MKRWKINSHASRTGKNTSYLDKRVYGIVHVFCFLIDWVISLRRLLYLEDAWHLCVAGVLIGNLTDSKIVLQS